jgi:hypothetical protein
MPAAALPVPSACRAASAQIGSGFNGGPKGAVACRLGPRFNGACPTAPLAFFLTRTSRLPMLGAQPERYDMGLISVLIGVRVIVVVGAICFWGHR